MPAEKVDGTPSFFLYLKRKPFGIPRAFFYQDDYIEQARQEIDILLKTRQRLLDEANRRTPLSYGMTEHTIYNVLGFNCQEYVDIVIKKAQELARQNGESLFID